MGVAIRLLVGLGNPGKSYQNTRHNLGAMLLARVVPDAVFRLEGKLHSHCYRDGELLLAQPNTAMNNSGNAVLAVARYYKVVSEEILVAHDELDLPPGVARFKRAGGAGGHRGVADIERALGTNAFYRLRLGIGHPGNRDKVESFVLSKPTATEAGLLEEAMADALRALPLALKGLWSLAMNDLNRKTR